MSKANKTNPTTFYQLTEEEKMDLFAEREEDVNPSTSDCDKVAVPDEEVLEQFKKDLNTLLPTLRTRKKAEYAENIAKLVDLLTRISQYSIPWCRNNKKSLEEFVSAIELQDLNRKEIFESTEIYIRTLSTELMIMHDAQVKKRIEELLRSPMLTREYKKAIFEIAKEADLAIDVKEI